jgi:hypothetical protein
MIGDIHVEYKCSRCGEASSAKADYWLSSDGTPCLMMDSCRRRLEREGWTFTERAGKFEPWMTKFISLCNECSFRGMKVEIAKEGQ